MEDIISKITTLQTGSRKRPQSGRDEVTEKRMRMQGPVARKRTLDYEELMGKKRMRIRSPSPDYEQMQEGTITPDYQEQMQEGSVTPRYKQMYTRKRAAPDYEDLMDEKRMRIQQPDYDKLYDTRMMKKSLLKLKMDEERMKQTKEMSPEKRMRL
jgi:hypothetical protein